MKTIIKKYYLYIIIIVITLISLIIANWPNDEVISYEPVKNDVIEVEIEYIYVDIKGEVSNPGVYKLEKNTRLFQLINKAGGLKEDADQFAVNLSLLLTDEQVIYIPNVSEEIPRIDTIITDEGNDLININIATLSELETLPGIGPSTAQSIIDYREDTTQFMSIEEIMDVPGIGESTFNEIKNLITV